MHDAGPAVLSEGNLSGTRGLSVRPPTRGSGSSVGNTAADCSTVSGRRADPLHAVPVRAAEGLKRKWPCYCNWRGALPRLCLGLGRGPLERKRFDPRVADSHHCLLCALAAVLSRCQECAARCGLDFAPNCVPLRLIASIEMVESPPLSRVPTALGGNAGRRAGTFRPHRREFISAREREPAARLPAAARGRAVGFECCHYFIKTEMPGNDCGARELFRGHFALRPVNPEAPCKCP